MLDQKKIDRVEFKNLIIENIVIISRQEKFFVIIFRQEKDFVIISRRENILPSYSGRNKIVSSYSDRRIYCHHIHMGNLFRNIVNLSM